MNDKRIDECTRAIFKLDQPITYQIQIAGQQGNGLSDLIQQKAQAAPMSKSVDQMSDAEVMKAYQLKMSPNTFFKTSFNNFRSSELK